ncbi:MFS transporter [Conexibacter sp. CPCC 206217]|uniref:MFS transporter n=1 Tax=Conexibacter sp. CPCC 206217 TaxID=3064574 RepID=UPI0027232688|nr:MFS transporter [Conexibacter sp. CPCC 206217]MDO8210780.1 MFS transporter [Conexibacter sp. CPCC 206217]
MQAVDNLRPSRRAWWIWGIGASFYFAAVFHRMALGVAGLRAEQRLHFDHEVLASFTALQFLIYLGMQIPAGLAADRIGPRKTLAGGLLAIAAGELIFGLAQSVPPAIAGRALIGFGDALILINVLRLTQSWFPARMGSLLAALTGVVGALGQLLGTIPLRAALEGIGWTATFVGSSAVTLLLFALALVAIRDRPPGVPAPTRADHAPIGATLKAAWARPGTRHGFWAHMAMMGPFQVVSSLWGAPFLIEGQHFDEASAATYLLITSAGFAVAGPLLGALADRGIRAQNRTLLVMNALVVLLWAAILCWPDGDGVPRALLMAGFAIVGAGAAGGMVAFALGRRETPSEAGGAATAIVNCGGFSAAIVALELAGLLLGGDTAPDAERFRIALAPMLVLSSFAFVRCLRLSRQRERAADAADAAANAAAAASRQPDPAAA